MLFCQFYTDKELTDSITFIQNNKDDFWATRVYQGNVLNIALTMPDNEIAQNVLTITQINFGYKKFGTAFGGNPGAAAGCTINIACSEANGWQAEENSVCLILNNNQVSQGTGVLLMNTCGTNRPFVLTAKHFLGADVSSYIFQFQYWSATCTPNSGWREDIQFNGCTLRASWYNSNFALLEMNTTPASNSGITYAGWSRNTTPATSATGLHHPRGDLMKFSHSFNPATAIPYLSSNLDFWEVLFDQGLVQFGSSGSPLFDQNHRVVGQLYGNRFNTCTTGDGDACWCDPNYWYGDYGRFDVSWTGGGTSSTRLSDWLDPGSSGVTTTNTTNINALFGYQSGLTAVYGNDVLCSASDQYTFLINGQTALVPITWSSSNNNIATVPPNGNPVTVTKIGTGTVTITGTLCNGRTASKQINVIGGAPSTTCQEIGNGTCNQINFLCPSQMNNWQYVNIPGTWGATGTGYHLQVNGGGYFNNGLTTQDITTNYFSVFVPSTGNNVTIWARNDCGVSGNTPYVVSFYQRSYGCYGSYYKVTPNPASNNVTISVDQNTTDLVYSSFNQISIYDQQGNLKLSRKFGKVGAATISIANLSNGIYILEISNGIYKENQQLIVQK